MTSSLPSELRPIANAAIDHALHGVPMPADITKLERWFEVEGWDDLVSFCADEILLNLTEVAAMVFSDSALIDYRGLDSNLKISDVDRIEFARQQIEYQLNDGDGCINPSAISYQLKSSDGKHAIFGCTVEIHGQGGPAVKWHGVFATKAAFYQYLHSLGYWARGELALIKDEQILSRWYEPTKSK